MPSKKPLARVFAENPRVLLYQDSAGEWHTPAGYYLASELAGVLRVHAGGVPGRERVNTIRIDREIRWGTWLAFVALLLGLGPIVWANAHRSSYRGPNEFGDFVAGTTGPLWALAGVLLVYVAFRGQERQSTIQEWEIETNRRQAQRQQFESVFFQLLGLHNEIVRNLLVTIHPDRLAMPGFGFELKPTQTQIHGRDIFGAVYQRVTEDYARTKVELESASGIKIDSLPREEQRAIIRNVYEPIAESYQSELGHYFRNLYTIVKFVANAGVESPALYTNILRAQLSSDELLMLFYNCISKYGWDDFKPLVERFHLLKTVPRAQLLSRAHRYQYRRAAYGRQNRVAP